ncbi:unnamed protein product [Cylindrotheca closterium]|uniref:Uncharacterized protein n=1 Tax=Cylindrotheca closterium TaxID=2856 RepID=A0AAD2FS88_9STRA|nr:unnamed protein product [Cylindrotheca closterium]
MMEDEEDNEPLLPTGQPDNHHPSLLLPTTEQEQSVPEVATFYEQGKRWFLPFRYAMKVAAANVFCSILVLVLLHVPTEYIAGHYSGRHGDPTWETQFQIRGQLSVGLAISLFQNLWNANICWNGAKALEKRADITITVASGSTQDNNRPSSGDDEETNSEEDRSRQVDIMEVSRRVDSMFGCNLHQSGSRSWTPQATFFVCLLYALCSLSTWQFVEGSAGFLLLHFGVANRDLMSKGTCFVSAPFQSDDLLMHEEDDESSLWALETLPEFESLPSGVQKWIASFSWQHNWVSGDADFNRSLPFVPLVDGSVVFAKAVPDISRSGMLVMLNSKEDPHSSSVVLYSSNAHIQEWAPTANSEEKCGYVFNDITQPLLFGFPSTPPYHAWCTIFHKNSLCRLQDEVLCQNSATGQVGRFKALDDTDSRNIYGGGSGWAKIYATENELWVATYSSISKNRRRRSSGGGDTTVTTLVSSFNIDSMTTAVVLRKSTTNEDYEERNNGRRHRSCVNFDWIRTTVSLVCLAFLSWYLYKLEVPACTVPAVTGVALLIHALFDPNAAGLILLFLAGVCLHVLVSTSSRNAWIRKYASHEMMVWALYSLQVSASWWFWSQIMYLDELEFDTFISVPVGSILLAVATAVLLNHPILQILAVAFSSFGFLGFFFVFAGLNYLLVPLFLLSLALGLFRGGSLLQMYRVQIIVCTRRLYLYCKRPCRSISNQQIRSR